MSVATADFWTDATSVFFTSFYGWSPETWGTVGWTGDRGLARRTNLLKKLTDPFITVGYVTSNTTYADPALKGMIAGFFLVSHEVGDRNDFTHPSTHALWPDQWRHSLRATRAFSYFPEYRIKVAALDASLLHRARHVSAMGEVLTDSQQIKLLREIPCVEVEVYTPAAFASNAVESDRGLVKPGPLNSGGYVVSAATQGLRRHLYVLSLQGDIDAYLGRSAEGRSIYKIGLSESPEQRRLDLQKGMPRGAFQWHVHSTTRHPGSAGYSFDAAVAGEDSMKRFLASNAEWLGGEFYLASEGQIEEAWQLGFRASKCRE